MSRHGLIQGKYRHEDGLWDDVRVSSSTVVNLPGLNEPQWLPFLDDGGGSEGTVALWFDIGWTTYFNIQLPHTWKLGTPIFPHVHWVTDAGAGPGDITWEMEWADAAPLTPFPPVTTVMPSNVDSVSGPYIHEIVGFPAPIFPTAISHVIVGRLTRIPSLGGPDYGGLIALLEMDFHFQLDDMGSVSQFNKG